MSRRFRRAWILSLLVAGMAGVGCDREPQTAPSDGPVLAKGGKPGSGGGSTLIPYVKLANLKALGCSYAWPLDISPQSPSAGAVRVGGYASCGGVLRLFTWTPGGGAGLIGDATVRGAVRGVADDQTMVGELQPPGPKAYAINGGTGPRIELPTTGYLYAGADAVSPNGNSAVGRGAKPNQGYTDCTSANSCEYDVLLWSRSGTGWSTPTVVNTTGGQPNAVTDDGHLILGRVSGHAVLWTPGTPWNVYQLPEDIQGQQVARGGEANAINLSHDVIAGYRELPLARDPTIQYEEHVVWKLVGGSWLLEPLKGYNIAEGIAYDVADYNGRTVVVGYSWDDTSGKGGTRWPTYWTWDRSSSTGFSAPQRLSQISETWGASATATNRLGQIVGFSATGSIAAGAYPVMWQLPSSWP